MTFTNSKSKNQPDYVFIIIVAALVLLGLFMLASAGSAVGYQKFGDSYYFVKHQLLFGIIPGVALMFALSMFDYRKWKKYTIPLLIATLLLLISVFLPVIGQSYGKARSWINLFGFSFQPSELAKLTLCLYLANWFSKKGEKTVKDFAYGFLSFAFILAVIMFLMILQPDIGTMTIIVAMAFAMYFVAGAKISHVLLSGGLGVGLLLLLIKIAPYRAARLTTFMNPELDPQGIGYHINQAFLAMGSGGFWGRGFGHSRQKFLFLPEVTGDSIFAVIGEELGFVMAAIIVCLFLAFAWRGIKIAVGSQDNYGKFLTIGIVFWITFQAFCNISAMAGLMPLTGVPLPFISHGGTALMVSLAAIGIVINISKNNASPPERLARKRR